MKEQTAVDRDDIVKSVANNFHKKLPGEVEAVSWSSQLSFSMNELPVAELASFSQCRNFGIMA